MCSSNLLVMEDAMMLLVPVVERGWRKEGHLPCVHNIRLFSPEE